MAPYTARQGGIFGSGLYQDSRPKIDVGGAIDSVTRGATSLIQNAYERRLADQQRQIQADERARQHTREDVLDKRAADEFSMRKDEHDAQMAASGYTPAHTETTTAVEPGAVNSDGLFGKKGSITGPKVTEKTSTVRGAYDYRKSAGYQVATDARGRKALEFATVYKNNFPNATDEEALQAGQYAADNPSIADNILFPRPDATTTHATNRNYDIKHPLPPRGGAGASSSPIGKALTTAKQRVDRNARDRTQAQTRFRGMHPGVNSLEDAGTAQDSTDFRRFQSADSAYAAEGTGLKATQDSLATRQLRENGLTPKTDSTKPAKQTPVPANAGAEEKRLRALAKQAIDNGADPAAVTQRLNQQLAAARKKK